MGVYDLKILRDGTDGNIYTYNDDYKEMAEDFGATMKHVTLIFRQFIMPIR